MPLRQRHRRETELTRYLALLTLLILPACSSTGDWRTGARRGIPPDPGMDVLGHEIVSQPAEIAGTGTGGKNE